MRCCRSGDSATKTCDRHRIRSRWISVVLGLVWVVPAMGGGMASPPAVGTIDIYQQFGGTALRPDSGFVPMRNVMGGFHQVLANGEIVKRDDLMWTARPIGISSSQSDAKAYVRACRVGGYADWRLPTKAELQQLYDPQRSQDVSWSPFGMTMNMTVPMHIAEPWRMGVAYVMCADSIREFRVGYGIPNSNAEQATAIAVDFSRGNWVGIPDSSDEQAFAIAVLGVRDVKGPLRSDEDVIAMRGDLMWTARDNGGDINGEEAKAYCEACRLGGYTDWRLPAIEELAGLLDTTRSVPLVMDGKVWSGHKLSIAKPFVVTRPFFYSATIAKTERRISATDTTSTVYTYVYSLADSGLYRPVPLRYRVTNIFRALCVRRMAAVK